MGLTDAKIRSLAFTGQQRTYFDDKLPGFGIRVGARSKAFVVKYGKNRNLRTLGHYPRMSL